MTTKIPTRSRQIVKERDNRQCRRCGCPGNQWHHRRRRRVGLGHDPHCPCIGIILCGDCHSWVHANPAAAAERGFIVSPNEPEPWTVPVYLFSGDWIVNSCEGGLDFTYDWALGEDGEPPRKLPAPWGDASTTTPLLSP